MDIGIVFPRFTGPYGGERLVINEAKELSKLNKKVTVYTREFEKSFADNLPKNLQIVEGIKFKTRNHQINALIDLLYIPFLIRKIKEKHDIIIVIGWQAALGGAIIKTFNNNKKVIYRCLEPPRFIYDLKNESGKNMSFFSKKTLFVLSPIIKLIDKISVKKCDMIISISENTQEQIKKIYGIDSTIVNPGIEIGRFKKHTKNEARKKLKIKQELKVYLSSSKLHKRKRIDSAMRFYEKKRMKNKTVMFVIGSGPEEKKLKESAQGIKDIVFLGNISDKMLELYLSAADYFVFTAKNEPFGIAPLEAKLAGCKIVPNDFDKPIKNWSETAKELNKIYSKALK